MATFPNGATASSTGSLRTGAPGGIVTVVLPPKVSGRSEPGTMADPLSARATWAPPCHRAIPVLVGKHDADARAANTHPRHLANRLIPEIARIL
jgi:hypothetical protein